MAFGNKASERDTELRTYTYGCGAPIENGDVARGAMRERVLLWNRLVELEGRFRVAQEALVAPFIAAPRPAERPPGSGPLTDAERVERDIYFTQRKAAFRIADLKEPLRDLDRVTAREAWAIAKVSPLSYCNYMDVYTAYLAARQRARKDGEMLRFHPTREPTKLSALWTHGWPSARLFETGERGYLHLVAPDPLAWSSPIRGERRRLARTKGRILVGRSDDGRPVWVPFRVVLHRPLPDGAVVRAASYVCERVGPSEHWHLSLVVETPRPGDCRQLAAGKHLAIVPCWRRTADGIRVAVAVDNRDAVIEHFLPSRWAAHFEKSEDIQAHRRRSFNIARTALAVWLRTHPAPDWLRDETRTVDKWESYGRLSGLIARWRRERFAGDEQIFDALDGRWRDDLRDYDGWRAQDKHLWLYQENMRDELRGERRELYRIFAAEVARTYDRVIVPELYPIRATEDDEPTKRVRAANHLRIMAAPATLRLIVRNAVRREGKAWEVAPARDIARRCHRCKALQESTDDGALIRVCAICGNAWDKDVNACRNLLALIERRAADGSQDGGTGERDGICAEIGEEGGEEGRVDGDPLAVAGPRSSAL